AAPGWAAGACAASAAAGAPHTMAATSRTYGPRIMSSSVQLHPEIPPVAAAIGAPRDHPAEDAAIGAGTERGSLVRWGEGDATRRRPAALGPLQELRSAAVDGRTARAQAREECLRGDPGADKRARRRGVSRKPEGRRAENPPRARDEGEGRLVRAGGS